MSIRIKVMLVVVVVFSLAGAAFLWTTYSLYESAKDQAADESLSVAARTFETLEAESVQKLSATLDVLMSREDLQEMFVAGDRDGLYDAALPMFEGLRERYAITHWYFIEAEPSSEIFLRVHSKDNNGDENKRDTFLAAVESKSYGAGKDLGKTAFALRVVHPWYDVNGELIGYMELGQEIEMFLDIMAEQTDNELALILKKDALDAEAWAEMRENRDQENDWDDLDEFVVAHATDEQVDEDDLEGVSIDSLPEGGEVFREEVESGNPTVVGAFPVTNTLGDRVGAVIVEHDVSELVDAMSKTRTQTIALLAGIGLVLVAALVLMLNSLVFKRLASMMEHMKDVSTRLAGGDFDVEMPEVTSNDEIGEFEKFVGSFLSAMAETLKQLAGK